MPKRGLEFLKFIRNGGGRGIIVVSIADYTKKGVWNEVFEQGSFVNVAHVAGLCWIIRTIWILIETLPSSTSMGREVPQKR